MLSMLLPEWGSPIGGVALREAQREPLSSSVSTVGSGVGVSIATDWSGVVDDAMLQFARGAHQRFCRWFSGRYVRVKSRGGIAIDVDASDEAMRRVGVHHLRAGQHVKMRTHYGSRMLDEPEEAVVLGVYNHHVVRRCVTRFDRLPCSSMSRPCARVDHACYCDGSWCQLLRVWRVGRCSGTVWLPRAAATAPTVQRRWRGTSPTPRSRSSRCVARRRRRRQSAARRCPSHSSAKRRTS